MPRRMKVKERFSMNESKFTLTYDALPLKLNRAGNEQINLLEI